MRRAIVVAVMVALSACSGASGAPLKLRYVGMTGDLVSGDGVRYVAVSSAPGDVTLLDVKTQARRTIPAPAVGCAFRDIHHGSLLWSCQSPQPTLDRGVTFDLATGQAALLAPPQPLPNSGPDLGTYTQIGEQWVKAIFAAYRPLSGATYVRRATGQQRLLDPALGLGRDHIVDLDAPSLTRKLCAGQRRPYVSTSDGIGVGLGDLAMAGRRAAATTYPAGGDDALPASVELQRCGAKPLTLKVCRAVDCGQPVIDDRIVAWVETKRGNARLVVRSLRTGRTRTTPIGPYPMTPVLVAGRLYVLAGQRLLGVAL
jgi:hypothetical protein